MDSRTLSVLISLTLVLTSFGATITVDDNGPAHYARIQAAIDDSMDGDVIVVEPGVYREHITFNGRQIVVRSTNPDDLSVVEATVILNDASPGVTFDFAEDERTVLQGFRLMGGGILCVASSPMISQNILRDCVGAGISGEQGAAPTIVNNVISSCTEDGVQGCGGLIQDNAIEGNRAGIAQCSGLIQRNRIAGNGPDSGMDYCDGEIAYNTVVGNWSASGGGGGYRCSGPIHHNIIAGNWTGGDGGGLHFCSGPIYNNTIVGNVAVTYGGGVSYCLVPLYDNIIANNEATSGGGIFAPTQSSYNAFWSNTGGNLSGGATVGTGDTVINPQFAEAGYWDNMGTTHTDDDVWVDGDYHLKSRAGRWDPNTQDWVADDVHSGCIDKGDPAADMSGEIGRMDCASTLAPTVGRRRPVGRCSM